MRIALIDGDLLLYRFGFRGQTEIQWDEDIVSRWTCETVAIGDMRSHIKRVCKIIRADRAIVCLTGKRCFRYELLSSYKHNRLNAQKPELYDILKKYINDNYEVVCKPNLEADDCLGIMATRGKHDTVVCSTDKDLCQIPGKHFNWDKDSKVGFITEREADLWFYRQALTGDSTDGFSGAPGIGKVKAQKILDSVEEGPDWEQRVWEKIVETYSSKGLSEDYALTQARMARILRASDYDLEKGEIRFWTPCK